MTDFATIKSALRQMLGPDIGIGVTNPGTPGGILFPEEKVAMARAVEKRRLEFTAGRVAARQAMAEIGYRPAAIPMAPDRSPVWPKGLVGSIAHCDTVCIAVVARTDTHHSLGIDVEPHTPLDPDLEATICTPAEQEWLDTQPQEQRGYLAKQIFCAKESFYKAQYPLTGKIIGFTQLTHPIFNLRHIRQP